eukprot:gene18006-biopygen13284
MTHIDHKSSTRVAKGRPGPLTTLNATAAPARLVRRGRPPRATIALPYAQLHRDKHRIVVTLTREYGGPQQMLLPDRKRGVWRWTPWGVVLDDTMKLRGITPSSLADQSNEAHACLGMVLAAVDGTEVRTLDAAKDAVAMLSERHGGFERAGGVVLIPLRISFGHCAVASPDAGVRLHFQYAEARRGGAVGTRGRNGSRVDSPPTSPPDADGRLTHAMAEKPPMETEAPTVPRHKATDALGADREQLAADRADQQERKPEHVQSESHDVTRRSQWNTGSDPRKVYMK